MTTWCQTHSTRTLSQWSALYLLSKFTDVWWRRTDTSQTISSRPMGWHGTTTIITKWRILHAILSIQFKQIIASSQISNHITTGSLPQTLAMQSHQFSPLCDKLKKNNCWNQKFQTIHKSIKWLISTYNSIAITFYSMVKVSSLKVSNSITYFILKRDPRSGSWVI